MKCTNFKLHWNSNNLYQMNIILMRPLHLPNILNYSGIRLLSSNYPSVSLLSQEFVSLPTFKDDVFTNFSNIPKLVGYTCCWNQWAFVEHLLDARQLDRWHQVHSMHLLFPSPCTSLRSKTEDKESKCFQSNTKSRRRTPGLFDESYQCMNLRFNARAWK